MPPCHESARQIRCAPLAVHREGDLRLAIVNAMSDIASWSNPTSMSRSREICREN